MAVAEGECVFVGEAGAGADEFESAFGKLLRAVIGEIFDEGIFAGHDAGEIESDMMGLDAPGASMLGEVFDFGGVE